MITTLKSKHPKTRYRTAALALVAIGLATPLIAAAAGQRYALLVGVGAYAELRKLQGPPNDVSAMKQALAAWGFDQITILQDAQATRAAILEKLDALAKDAEPGSQVLFYFSGHGTSPVDPKFGAALALPHTTGALLPYDARKSGDPSAIRRSLLIGREDLRPRFEALDRKGVHLTAWIDACFSENSTHSLGGLTARAESIPGFNPGSLGSGSGGYEAYPYKNAVTLAASAANQIAADIDEKTIRHYPTRDGRAHGAFSDALLRALNDRSLPGYGVLDRNGDGGVSVEELATGVTHFMASRHYGQEPKLQPLSAGDGNGTRNQPLFFADQRPQPTAPTPAPAKPDSAPPVAANLSEPQRRQAMLDRIVSATQQTGRATVGLELASPYATSRLPIGDQDHCVKVDLAYKADQKGYPLIIDLFSDGGMQWLYPLSGADDRKQRGQWQQPLSAGQAVTLWSAQTTPPAGVDTLYTFLLDQPLPENVVTGSYAIKPNDGARFDLLLDALDKPGRVRGAHRLSLDIYEPKADELKSWPEEKCK